VITLLVPTRARPDNVRRLLASVDDTAHGDVDAYFYVDEDDPTLAETTQVVHDWGGTSVVGPRIVLSEMWNRCWREAEPDVAMHCGDDIVFRTDGWDARVAAEFERFPDRIAFVHGEDGVQGGRIGTHGFLHRNWVDALGYFVPPYFSSDFNDLWLSEVADALGRRVYLPDVYTEHMHPVVGKAPLDQTHQDRLTRHQTDRVEQRYRDLAAERAADVAKLRAVVDVDVDD
jgi:hypothetical protein